MKWTRTDEIDFDPNDLPDEVYSTLIRQFISETGIGISASGELFTHHMWDGETGIRYKQKLQDEIRDFVKGSEEEALRRMLKVLDEAREIVSAALPHNAEVTGA